MSDATTEHDNSWLMPYLREIAAAEEHGGFPVDDTEAWATDEMTASKIRQTLYITKFARKDKATNCLVLTEAGRAFIA